jgi:Lipid A 3-O-deacylase (PagL)
MDGNDHVLRKRSGWKSAEDRNERPGKFVRVRWVWVVLVLSAVPLGFFPKSSPCQEAVESPRQTVMREKAPIFTDITIWVAQTVGSTNVMSTYSGQEMFSMGVGLRRHLYGFPHTEMRWNFEIIPLCMPSFPNGNGRTHHYGGGGALGLSFEPRRPRRVQPFVDVNFGLLGFTDETPVNTRRTNFSLQFGPGFTVPLRGRSSLKTGITFFHFSNMHTVGKNPGFDGLLIYVGYSFRFQRGETGAE